MESGYLAKVFADLGPESCDRNMFSDVIQQLAPQVAQGGGELAGQIGMTLTMMCRTSNGGGSSSAAVWNTDSFGSAVLEVFPKVDVDKVLAHLDNPQLIISGPGNAEQVIRGLKSMSKVSLSQKGTT